MPRNPACQLCPLYENSSHVCVWGVGPPRAAGMIVGMNPGKEEDAAGAPFVGPSGRKLDELLSAAGLRRADLYITNAAKCRTPGNAEPDAQALAACRVYLKEEIATVQPSHILALGNSALRTLTARSGIKAARALILPLRRELGDCKVYATYHPAAVLRDPSLAEDVVADLRNFARALTGGALPEPPTEINPPWEDFEAYLRSGRTIAYDIETRRTNKIWKLGLDDLEMIQFYDGEKVIIYEGVGNCKRAAELARRIQPHLVGYNSAQFDDQIVGLSSDDAMLLAYLHDERGGHSLEAVAMRHLGAQPWKYLWEESNSETNDGKRRYGALDVYWTYQVWRRFVSTPQRHLYSRLLLRASRNFGSLQRRGLFFDIRRLKATRQELEEEVRADLQALKEASGNPSFKVGSPKHIAALLYDKLGLPCDEWTESGQRATGESVLKRLYAATPEPHIQRILRVRHARKMVSTYLTGFEKFIEPDGRAHPQYFLVTKPTPGREGGTVTGRSSASDPAIQTMPREPRIRSIVAAPPGKLLLSADFSQIEARLAAWIANETNMLSAFKRGEDIHTLMAREILEQGGVQREPTSEERARAKPANYLMLYGGSPQKYMEVALKDYDLVITYEEARKTHAAFHKRWPGIHRWHQEVAANLKRDKQLRTVFGRVRHLPDIDLPAQERRAAALRAGINFLVQSAASDLAFLGLNLLCDKGYEVVAFLHDSYLIEIEENLVENAVPQVRTILEEELPEEVKRSFGFTIEVPIRVDIKVSKNWS